MPLQDPLIQNAALQDLCFLAEATGPDAWRRKLVFDKDSGETWRQVSIVCMDEVSFISYSRTPFKQNTGLHHPAHMHQVTTILHGPGDLLDDHCKLRRCHTKCGLLTKAYYEHVCSVQIPDLLSTYLLYHSGSLSDTANFCICPARTAGVL